MASASAQAIKSTACATCAMSLTVLVGCVTIAPRPELTTSTAAGKALLTRALDAHGGEAFSRIKDVAVSYDGEWKSAVWVFQPILIDRGYRKRSEERILLPELAVGQRHFGPQGEKQVFQKDRDVTVWYDGALNSETLKDRAAAAVVDGYLMFLLGPFYLHLRGAVVDVDRPAVIDGRPCDQLRAVLRPGFGSSPQDDVLMAIDSESGVVRRLRFTFNALPTTQGVVADVLPTDYLRMDGVLWPTQFVEVIKNPLVNLEVHRWRVIGLDTNRGSTLSEISEAQFSGKAAAPAGLAHR